MSQGRPLQGRELPAPVATTGPCKAGRLVVLLIPQARKPSTQRECPSLATRRVLVNGDVIADLCLWHSLRATEQLGAQLVRAAS